MQEIQKCIARLQEGIEPLKAKFIFERRTNRSVIFCLMGWKKSVTESGYKSETTTTLYRKKIKAPFRKIIFNIFFVTKYNYLINTESELEKQKNNIQTSNTPENVPAWDKPNCVSGIQSETMQRSIYAKNNLPWKMITKTKKVDVFDHLRPSQRGTYQSKCITIR